MKTVQLQSQRNPIRSNLSMVGQLGGGSPPPLFYMEQSMNKEMKAGLDRLDRKLLSMIEQAKKYKDSNTLYHMEDMLAICSLIRRAAQSEQPKVFSGALHCPTCGPADKLIHVVDSREAFIFGSEIKTQVRRRRCGKCGTRFNTLEVSAPAFDFHSTW